jgi:DNA-binding phage protein
MGKTKTSQEQEKSSPRKLKLKSREGIRIHHPEKTLMDEKLVSESILQCLKENDTEALMEILEGYLSVLNRSKFSRESNVPRRTLYHALRKRNPTIKTLGKIFYAACH